MIYLHLPKIRRKANLHFSELIESFFEEEVKNLYCDYCQIQKPHTRISCHFNSEPKFIIFQINRYINNKKYTFKNSYPVAIPRLINLNDYFE